MCNRRDFVLCHRSQLSASSSVSRTSSTLSAKCPPMSNVGLSNHGQCREHLHLG
jgi:hypothetical protein